MKIWGRANSINVMKVLWCADECGIAYDRENVGLQYGGNDQKWYLDMNPNGVVPTIDVITAAGETTSSGSRISRRTSTRAAS